MKLIKYTVLILLYLVAFGNIAYAGASNPPIISSGNVPNLNNKLARVPWAHGGLQQVANPTFSAYNQVALSNGTDSTQNSRFEYTTTVACTDIRFVYPGWNWNVDNDISFPNAIFVHAGLEYLSGSYGVLTCSDQKDIVIQPGATITTDPFNVVIPANTRFWVRTYTNVAQPPTSPSATAVLSVNTVGLASATQYFYKITSLTATGESGPSSEVSATTDATHLSIQLAWTAANASVTYNNYKIYRSTATGTEVYYASTTGPGLNFTDSAQFAIGTGSPPAVQKWGNNNQGSSRDGVDGVSANGTVDLSVGGAISTNSTTAGYGPLMVIGRAVNNDAVSVIGVGDSIIAGFGTDNVVGTCAFGVGGFVPMALGLGTPISYTNLGVSSSSVKALSETAALNFSRQRTKNFFSEADYAVLLYGHNAIYGAPIATPITLSQLEGYIGEVVKNLSYHGAKVYVCTDPPMNTVSTDQWQTIGNQLGPNTFNITGATNANPIVITNTNGTNLGTTNYFHVGDTVVVSGVGGNTNANGTWVVSAATVTTCTLTGASGNSNYTSGGTIQDTTNEATRTALNAWEMAPASAGVGNSILADYPGFVAGTWDTTASVEYNVGGTQITRSATTGAINNGSGGYWGPSAATVCTGTATSSTSTVLTNSGATFNSTNPDGYSVVITSGTGANQLPRTIISHTGTTITVLNAFSPTPDNTSHYSVVETLTKDGIHPSNFGSSLMAGKVVTSVFIVR